MSCYCRNREKVKNVQFFLFKVVYYDLQNSNRCPFSSAMSGLSRFSPIIENRSQIRRQSFLEAGCNGTRSAPSALHFVPLCLQSALFRRPKLRFSPEKLIKSTLLRQELIIHWNLSVIEPQKLIFC